MTSQKETNQNLSPLITEEVVHFLRKNPDFFNTHADLLTELEVPHTNTGSAISLVERQVVQLREQNQQLRKQLHELIEISRQNEELAHRMHQLALTLMDAAGPKDLFSTLYENLKRNFHADRVAVRLFASPAFVDTYAGVEFAGQDCSERSLYKTLIEKREPLCGRVKQQQQEFLFSDEADEIASSVMVPLHGPCWDGILCIGSFDPERFQPGMGVELLANMGEILSFILKPWIQET